MYKYFLFLFLFVFACSPSNKGKDKDKTPDDYISGPNDVGSPNVDDDGDGYSEVDGDCDDGQPAINPMATDIVGDNIDQNCDGADGFDADGDGHADKASGGDDCDDTDGTMFPGAVEIWYDGIRQDCDDKDAPYWSDGDQDGDGFDAEFVGGTDCDDTDKDNSPGIIEDNDNGIDDNCNGVIDNLSLTLTWEPGITFEDLFVEDTLVLTIEGTDIGEWGTSLMVSDWQQGGRTSSATLLGDTDGTVHYEVRSDGMGIWGTPGPSVYLTYFLATSSGCIVWGYDASEHSDYFGGRERCRLYDPTL